MNPLTPEQKQKIQNFTPEQKSEYNRYRSAGFQPLEALDIVSVVPESTERPIVSALKKVPEDLISGGKKTVEDFKEDGVISAVQRYPIRQTGALGRVVGDVVGGVLGEADELITGGAVGDALEKGITTVAETQPAQNILRGISKVNERSDGILSDAFDALNLTAIGALKSAPATAMKESFIKAIKDIPNKTIEINISRGTRPLSSFFNKPDVDVSATTNKLGEFVTRGKADDLIEQTTAENISVDEKVLRNAVARGFADNDAVFYSQLSPVDKKVGSELLALAEKGNIDKRGLYGSRPVDIVGKNMTNPIKELKAKQKEFGKAVDTEAKALQGQKIDTTEIKTNIENILDEAGITRTDDGFDFSGSRYEFVPEMQKNITDTINKVLSGLEDGDAYRVHNLKKAIDESVDYAKTKDGLTGNAQTLIKSIRRTIDDELDNQFPTYNEANTKFADMQNFIDDTNAIFGKNNVLTDERAANRLRRVFSNADSRGDIKKYIESLDEYAKKYGVKTNGNLYDQLLITEDLEKIYGTQAITGLQGEVKKAIQTAQKIIQGVRNPVQGVLDVAASGAERAIGQTDEARTQFLRDLFNETQPQ